MLNNKKITSADQLIPGEIYFLEQNDFIGSGKFMETKPPKKMYKGANAFVPNSQPLAYFDGLTLTCNDHYELFEACKENNVRIYEDKDQEIEIEQS